MRVIGVVIIFTQFLIGRLIPTPFITEPEPIQRAGYNYAFEYLDKRLIGETYGIAMVKPRGTNSTLVILSDEVWDRLLYTNLVEGSKQEAKYLRMYGESGSGYGQFYGTRGLCIDTAVYEGNMNEYAIYVADWWNSRVVKLKYLITQDTIISDGILIPWFQIGNPTDVACVTKSGGGAYIVVVERDKHRIQLYQRDADGNLSYIQSYGIKGSGYGNFFKPNGVAICQATDGGGGYFIYVTDTGNRRVICLRYKPTEGIIWHRVYKTMQNAQFLSVTASQYYCVYVADFTQNKIWVFTPGLTELLYSYGDASLLNGPKDVYIDWDRIGLTERWTAGTGIQYFKIIPEIREFYPSPGIFDATEDSVKIKFKVYETKHYLTMTIPDAGVTLFEEQEFEPDSYSVWWDGRDSLGRVVLPGEYLIRISCQGLVIATTTVRVKGTRVAGVLSSDEHWTEQGEPYVLIGDVQLANQPNSKLEIDPGVKVMPTGNYGIFPPVYHSGSVLLAKGNAINKILFTPHRKLYPVSDSVPKGFWKGIVRYGDRSFERLVFKYCVIEAAGSDSGAIWASPRTSYLSITETEISKSGRFGLYFDDHCDTVLVYKCHFIDNDSIPIVAPFKFIGEIYQDSFVDNKPNVIAVTAGTRDTDATIHNQGVPYWFLKGHTREFKVQGNDADCPVLSIEPGVKMLFQDSCGLYAQSRSKIIALGLPDSMIVFTALDTTRPWRGVHLNNSNPADTSVFEYCELSYGGRRLAYPYDACAGNLALFDNKGVFVLKNCRILGSMSYGVGDAHIFETDTCISIVQDNLFYGNDSFPLVLSTTELGQCKGNQFIDNKTEGILVRGGGDIRSGFRLENQGVPYVIDCHLVLNGWAGALARLDIESGNVLAFRAKQFLIKGYGLLRAKGVTFTSHDSVWWGMKFEDSKADTSCLDSCIIEKARVYGGVWPQGAVEVSNSNIRISNSTIMDNEQGVYLSGASRLNFVGNLVVQNLYGIRVSDCEPNYLEIKSNDFSGNRCAFVTDFVYPYIDADSNFWGDASGPWDPSDGPPDYNPGARGDSIGDYVEYRPWLTEPVHPPVVELIWPNGGDTLYSGLAYKIIWQRSVEPLRQELSWTRWQTRTFMDFD